jgi:hypothetical protein
MAKHFLEPGLIIHCDGPLGEGYALCGAAVDGVNGDEAWPETHASINCSHCIKVLDFCRKVRPGEVCSPFQRRNRHT